MTHRPLHPLAASLHTNSEDAIAMPRQTRFEAGILADGARQTGPSSRLFDSFLCVFKSKAIANLAFHLTPLEYCASPTFGRFGSVYKGVH
jgi:hypothetical protein